MGHGGRSGDVDGSGSRPIDDRGQPCDDDRL